MAGTPGSLAARPSAARVSQAGYDAHSHVLEHDGWLAAYCDADVRTRLAPARADTCPAPAPGTEDPAARSRALDLLGLQRQLVLTTTSVARFAGAADPDLEHGGALGHNRGIMDFCADDRRLLPVAYLPLRRLADTVRLLDLALSAGARGVLVAAGAAAAVVGRPELDAVWSRLADAAVPLVLHPAGGTLDRPTEEVLAGLVLGGSVDSGSGLRVAVLGAGASWVPALAQRLDAAGPRDGVLPSARVRRALAVTPSRGEELAPLVAALGPWPWLASPDGPGSAGGASALRGLDAAAREAFLLGNLDRLLTGPA